MKRLAENRSADRPRHRHRGRRWAAGIAATFVLLLAIAFAVLRIKFEGEDLGDNIADMLNKKMRGRIQIGSVEWPSAALQKVITGGWVPLTMRDVRVYDDCALSTKATADDQVASGDPNEDCTPDDRPDPDPSSHRKPRKLVLQTDLITAEIDIHALMFGHHDFVFRNLWVYGGEALLEQTREPYPLHAYERTVVSIVSAFYPRMHAGFRAGIYADAPPPIFDLRDIHLQGLNLTMHMAPNVGTTDRIGFSFTIRMEGVDVDSSAQPKNDSYLYMDPTDPLVSKFYLRLGLTGKRGRIRILDEGPRSAFLMTRKGEPEVYPPRTALYELYLADIHLDRLAQLPTQWARHDFVANNLEIDLSARTLPCPSGAEPAPPAGDGATLHLAGELNNFFDRPYDGSWNLKLDALNLGPTIHSCIKSKVSGNNLNGTITLTGPFVALPKVTLDLKNLDFDVPLRHDEEPLKLALAEVHGSIDLVNDQGYIEKTKALVRGNKEPGEVDISATFGLKPYNGNANIEIAKPIDVGRFLPPKIRSSVGRFLSGRLSARGDVSEGFALEDFDLALGATPSEKAIRAHRGRLFTNNDFASIHIEKVNVEAGRSHAVFDGYVDIGHDDMRVTIEGDFPDLDVWLKRFGLPAFAKSAPGGTFTLSGKLTAPRINARTTLTGVPCIDKLSLDNVSVENGVVDVTKMSSAGLGGSITGNARVRLGNTPVIEKLHLDGSHLDAARICGLEKYAKGTIDGIEVDLHGTVDKTRTPLDWMDLATIYAHTAHLTVLGDPYSTIAACINRKDHDDPACRPRPALFSTEDLDACTAAKRAGGSCAVVSATRDIGGTLDGTIAKLPAARIAGKQVPPRLGGTLAIADIPLAVLDQFTSQPLVGGLASATLHLSGSPTAPQATGAIQLLRAWALAGFLGDPQLAVEPTTLPTGAPGLKLHGITLAGRLEISGTVGTTAPYPIEMAVTVHRVEIDQFVDLTKLLHAPDPIQAWVTGTITVRTELKPAGKPAPEAWIELTELQGTINHRSADNHIVPLALALADPRTRMPGDPPDATDDQPAVPRAKLSVHVTPTSLEFACRDPKVPGKQTPCPTKLATPAGIVLLQGQATKDSIALEAHGRLSLPLVAPLLDKLFDHVEGDADLTATASGTLALPTYEVSLDLHNIVARPIGSDTVMETKTGLIKLANGSLGFTDLKVNVKDEHRDEHGEITVHGGIKLEGFTPASWGVYIDGKLAAKMLLVLLPGVVSQATGVATIGDDALRLWGKGPRPLIAGSLEFDPTQPVSVLPRGVRRELSFSRGNIEISTCAAQVAPEPGCPQLVGDHRTYLVAINDVGGKIDNEGLLTSLDGNLELTDNVLTKARIGLDAHGISFQIPHTLDLVLDVHDMSIALDGNNARVGGSITVVNGSYTSNFELTDRITKAGVRAVPSKPFWESYPALGNADLHLRLDVRKFRVDNNIATIDMNGDIAITNTPRDPRLAGSIGVASGGSFRVPGTRAAFVPKSGSVTFTENESAYNPKLDLVSEADYTDLSGQEHIITATISGSLEQPQWDLKTSTGYNKSQTLSLLVLGRNQEQLRRSLGDQSLGVDPTHVDPSTNPSQGFADQIVKDLAGDWVSGVVGNNIKGLVGLDVLRIEIGFGSVGAHIEKKLADNVKLLGEVEQTIRGQTYNFNGVLKLPYQITLQAGYLNKNFYDPAEQDITDGTLKLVYRLFIP